jgi:hypothetical protein
MGDEWKVVAMDAQMTKNNADGELKTKERSVGFGVACIWSPYLIKWLYMGLYPC